MKIHFGNFSEMLEAVGHEFMETFFRHCEAALAEDGIFVLQVTFSFSFSLQANFQSHVFSQPLIVFFFFL